MSMKMSLVAVAWIIKLRRCNIDGVQGYVSAQDAIKSHLLGSVRRYSDIVFLKTLASGHLNKSTLA